MKTVLFALTTLLTAYAADARVIGHTMPTASAANAATEGESLHADVRGESKAELHARPVDNM
jgi:hypothetical protein